MRVLAVLAVLASLALAGCLGVEGPAQDPALRAATASGPGDGAAGPGAGDVGPGAGGGSGRGNGLEASTSGVALDLGGAAVHETMEEDGAFQGPDAWWPAHFALWAATGQDQPSAQVRDITAQVPAGVPVRVRAEVAAEVAHGSLGLFVGAADSAYYTYRAQRQDAGTMSVDVLLGRNAADAVVVGVTYGDPEPAPSVPYHLSIQVDYDPHLAPPGVPIALPLAGGAASLALDFPEGPGEGPGLVLFGPADDLVLRVDLQGPQVRVDLGAETAPGEHVLLLRGDAPATVRVTGLAPGRAPRPLPLELAWGQVHTLQGPGEVGWDFTATPGALQVCEVLRGTANFMLSHSGGITGPAGEVLAFDHGGDFWTFSNAFWCTDPGAAAVVPGAYAARFAAQAAVDAEVTEVVAHYKR